MSASRTNLNFLILVLSTVILPASMHADDSTPPAIYATLAQRRPNIVLPAYTAAEKQQVANQAQILLKDVYVNREVKTAAYGTDPIAAVADIVANASFISEDALHARLEDVISSQHDLHLSYSYPAPYSCYRSLLPIALAGAKDPMGKSVLAVESVTSNPAVLELASDARQISTGDVLLSYDDADPVSVVKRLGKMGRGSNEFGVVRRAIENMTYRSHRHHSIPLNDAVRMRFLNRTGSEYTVVLPWVSKADLKCLGFTSFESARTPQAGAQKDQGLDDYQIEFERFYKPHKRSNPLEELKDTEEPTVHFDQINNEFGKFALLRLDSFSPEKLSWQKSAELIKNLLENELAHTDGLILDLRDNGGGTISYAESLVQLLTPSNIQPQGFRLQNTAVIRDLFAAIPTWSQEYRDALSVANTIGAKYTSALPLTAYGSANETGQSYFKPVAVLTNSACYSSCDMMTALLQDLGVAEIFGEDGRTGGGGANNVQLDYFTSNLPAGHAMPFATMPGKQSMGVAWRQTVRVGKHKGELLEEKGVAADQIAQPSTADFFADDMFQLRKISAFLNRSSAARQSWYKPESVAYTDLPAGSVPEFGMTVGKTEAVEYRASGQTIGYQSVQAPAAPAGTSIKVTPSINSSLGSFSTLEIIGYDQGERVWRAVKKFRFIPESTVLVDTDKINIDFATDAISPLVIFTAGVDQSEGWSVQNGKLKTGKGDRYIDDVETRASLFLDLSTRTGPLTLSFDVEGKTEEDYDFFSVTATCDGVQTEILAPVSGLILPHRVTGDLAACIGKKAEISLVFTSDGNTTDLGVSLGNLVVE